MEIQDIINYVMHTPNNSNPAVLRSLLEELKGDTPQPTPPEPEYITRVEEQEFTGEYNPEYQIYVATLISEGFEDDEVIVTYDGVDYTCTKYSENEVVEYGAIDGDFTDYPFTIYSEANGSTFIFCQDGDTHTVEVKTLKDPKEGTFEVCEVNVICSVNDEDISGVFVQNDQLVSEITLYLNDSAYKLQVVLYSGVATLKLSSSFNWINTSGDVSVSNAHDLIVTGDGAATIAPGK